VSTISGELAAVVGFSNRGLGRLAMNFLAKDPAKREAGHRTQRFKDFDPVIPHWLRVSSAWM
jgi:hypothetical protein